MLQFNDLVVAPSVEFEHVLVEFEQTASVGYCEQGYLQLLRLQVQLCLDVHAHGRGALVQNGEEGTMVEESRHCYSLLLASGKDVVPVVHCVKSFLPLLEVV